MSAEWPHTSNEIRYIDANFDFEHGHVTKKIVFFQTQLQFCIFMAAQNTDWLYRALGSQIDP